MTQANKRITVFVTTIAACVCSLGCGQSTPVPAALPNAQPPAHSTPPPAVTDASDEVEAEAEGPQVTIRRQTTAEAFKYLWRTLRDMPFFRQHGYRVALPEHPAFQDLSIKDISEYEIEKEHFRQLFINEVYNPGHFDAALQKLAEVGPTLSHATQAFKQYNDRWGFKLFDHYQVLLTLYGPGGSYDPDTGTIILFTTPEGRFKKPAVHTIVHEIVHIGIEELIVQRLQLTHSEKERVVDRICWLEFADILPDYKTQKQGPPELDSFVTKESLLDLPEAIERYVQAYPRR